MLHINLLTKITQIPESAKTDKHPDNPDQVLAKWVSYILTEKHAVQIQTRKKQHDCHWECDII